MTKATKKKVVRKSPTAVTGIRTKNAAGANGYAFTVGGCEFFVDNYSLAGQSTELIHVANDGSVSFDNMEIEGHSDNKPTPSAQFGQGYDVLAVVDSERCLYPVVGENELAFECNLALLDYLGQKRTVTYYPKVDRWFLGVHEIRATLVVDENPDPNADVHMYGTFVAVANEKTLTFHNGRSDVYVIDVPPHISMPFAGNTLVVVGQGYAVCPEMQVAFGQPHTSTALPFTLWENKAKTGHTRVLPALVRAIENNSENTMTLLYLMLKEIEKGGLEAIECKNHLPDMSGKPLITNLNSGAKSGVYLAKWSDQHECMVIQVDGLPYVFYTAKGATEPMTIIVRNGAFYTADRNPVEVTLDLNILATMER